LAEIAEDCLRGSVLSAIAAQAALIALQHACRCGSSSRAPYELGRSRMLAGLARRALAAADDGAELALAAARNASNSWDLHPT
jgi:hypothetical protein